MIFDEPPKTQNFECYIKIANSCSRNDEVAAEAASYSPGDHSGQGGQRGQGGGQGGSRGGNRGGSGGRPSGGGSAPSGYGAPGR